MIEGARIDHANHSGNAYRALTETVALSDAVRVASELTSADDTLIIVTADHSHTLNFVGYPARGNPILGKVKDKGGEDGAGKLDYALDGTGQPYTTLSYAMARATPAAATSSRPARSAIRTTRAASNRPTAAEPARGRHRASGLHAGSAGADEVRIARWRGRRHLGTRPGQQGDPRHAGTERDLSHDRAGRRPCASACARPAPAMTGVPVQLPAPTAFERKAEAK